MKPLKMYLDYQEYLRDYYEEKKEEFSFFSYRYMGNRIDLDPSFLVKVLQGKMHLSIKSIPRVCDFCKFDDDESEYFETLVRFGRAQTSKETKIYFEKLLSMREMDVPSLTEDQYSYYNAWYHSSIRSLLSFYNWKRGYAQLGKQLSPAISKTEVKESITLLKRLDLIAPDNDGFYRPTDKVVSTGNQWRSVAIHNFQRETIELAKESLDRHSKEIRDISTVTISVSHKDLEEIRARAAEFRKSLLQLKTDNSEADIVYQVNLQIIPTTQLGGVE